jgi:hypothetical protein
LVIHYGATVIALLEAHTYKRSKINTSLNDLNP